MSLDLLFFPIALLIIGFSVALFALKKILRAVIALSGAFLMSSLFFLYLGQTLAALLQLFVFVGGLPTYLIVAVAAEEKDKERFDIRLFFLLALLLSIVLSSTFMGINTEVTTGNNFLALAGSALQAYSMILYLIVFMLFSATIGSILAIKKFVKLVV